MVETQEALDKLSQTRVVTRARFMLSSGAMRSLLIFALVGWLAAAPPNAAADDQEPEPQPVSSEPVPPPVVAPVVVAPVVSPPPVVPIAPDPTPQRSGAPTARGFQFGSYGRLIAGSDLRGGKPESANVVAHGPRIVEPSYLELDLSYEMATRSGHLLRPVITLAFDGTLFHDTGDFDARPALRNMYLDAEITAHVSAWVGSRMYRGDDIYLFDVWPLDDLNTVGGGLRYHTDKLELAGHAGVNRLNRDFQFQQVDVANPEQGATTIVQLNRQRLIASATASYRIDHGPDAASWKIKAHGELHALPSGTRRLGDGTFEALPADTGLLVGIEAGTYGYAPSASGFRRHLNVFARYAKGLAAFDELVPPTSFGSDKRTDRANELLFGASGNWDHALGNVMIAALSRRFVDSDGSAVDHDDGWEYAVAARSLAAMTREVFVGAELSYQARFPRGLNPNTERAEDLAVAQIAPMLVYSPMGPSSYDRPQLRIVYRLAHLNNGAREGFVPDDPRHAYTWTHFLGVQAEWWFNSSTYNR